MLRGVTLLVSCYPLKYTHQEYELGILLLNYHVTLGKCLPSSPTRQGIESLLRSLLAQMFFNFHSKSVQGTSCVYISSAAMGCRSWWFGWILTPVLQANPIVPGVPLYRLVPWLLLTQDWVGWCHSVLTAGYLGVLCCEKQKLTWAYSGIRGPTGRTWRNTRVWREGWHEEVSIVGAALEAGPGISTG